MIKHVLAIGMMALTLGAQAQVPVGQNLIANGNAENGAVGWLPFEGYELIQSVAYGSSWVKPTEPGPTDRGLKLFAGLGARGAAYQTIELGSLGGQAYSYTLSGWLGGWTTQGDNAMLYVAFQDSQGNEIGSAKIGPVTPANRSSKTGLLLRQATGALPAGTAKLTFTLSMERLSGGDNDGYADNLSFVLTKP